MFTNRIQLILFRLFIAFICSDITEVFNLLVVECSDLSNELVLGVDKSLPDKLKLVEPDLESESATKAEKKNSDDESSIFRSIDATVREKLGKFKIDLEAMERETDDIIAPVARRATLENLENLVGTKRKASSEESPFQEFHSAPDSAFREAKKPK